MSLSDIKTLIKHQFLLFCFFCYELLLSFLTESIKIVSSIIFCVLLSEWWTAARDWKERDWSGTKISEIYVYVLNYETSWTLESDYSDGNEHVKRAIGLNRCGHTSNFTHGRIAVVFGEGKQLFVCGRFPKGEIAPGKFPWIRKKEQKNYLVLEVSSMG